MLFKAPYKMTVIEFDKFKLRLFLCIDILSCVYLSSSNTSAGTPRISGPKVKRHHNQNPLDDNIVLLWLYMPKFAYLYFLDKTQQSFYKS